VSGKGKIMEINEFDERLEQVLSKLDGMLTEEEVDVLRYACGKSRTKNSHEVMQDIFNDFGTIFKG
jgi:hypothetical protein